MFLNRYLHIVYFCLLSIWASSCSTAYYLENYPVLAEDVFYRKVLSAVKKLDNDIDSAFLNALKLRTQYTFAFVVEKADRLIEVDYDAGKALYVEGLLSFEQAIEYGKSALKHRHPELQSLKDLIIADVTFNKADIPYLYWLAAAYGGAIGCSRGKSHWVIQLPKVGYLLETALAIDPSWNYGALHSVMISYSMVRADLQGNNVEEAKRHFNAAMRYSRRNDAGAMVSYAENVCVYEQEKERFVQILNTVINMNVNINKELSLGNIIARDRARWLLSREEELFY